ncbi:MAG: ATP-binding protein [Phycisphaerales bacterium]|nr:ATP-binding protein [Phycisphaerales bacterium]
MSDTGKQGFGEKIDLRVTSEPEHIATVRQAVQEAAAFLGFAEEAVAAVTLAINEAMANVIQHGYGGRAGQPIEVIIEPVHRGSAVGLQMTVRDCCPHIDPSTIVGRDLKDVRPGGLGTHIIKTAMDEVEYTQRRPQGMCLRMLKMLNTPPTRSGPDRSTDQEDSAHGRS